MQEVFRKRGYTIEPNSGEGDVLITKGGSKTIIEIKVFQDSVKEGDNKRAGRAWIERSAHQRLLAKAKSIGASAKYIAGNSSGSNTFMEISTSTVSNFFKSHPSASNYKITKGNITKNSTPTFSRPEFITIGEFYTISTQTAQTSLNSYFTHLSDQKGSFYITPMFDGIRVQVHRLGEMATIYDERGVDITSQYEDICSDFNFESWPQRVVMDGYITGWTGKNGYLSGKHVPPSMFQGVYKSPNSYSFHPTDLLYLEDEEHVHVTPETDSEFRLHVLSNSGPASGGKYIHIPSFTLVDHDHHLPRAIHFHSNIPGAVGVELRGSGGYHSPVSTYIDAHAVYANSQGLVSEIINQRPRYELPNTVETRTSFGLSHDGGELPEYIEIEGPLFVHGDLIDGTGKKFHYSEDVIRNARLVAPPGQSLPFVNFEHDSGPERLAGVMLKVWFDEKRDFSFVDAHGRTIEGTGVLMQRSLIKEPRAIWSILHGKLGSVSAEPMFEAGAFDKEFPDALDAGMTGMALTSTPAISTARIEIACDDKKCVTPP